MKRDDRDDNRQDVTEDPQAEALAECYRILMEAGAIKPPGEGGDE